MRGRSLSAKCGLGLVWLILQPASVGAAQRDVIMADQRGATLALRGDPARGIAACAGCHALRLGSMSLDESAPPSAPPLAGRSMQSLNRLLQDAQAGAMQMPGSAHTGIARLTSAERAALAAYYAQALPISVK